MQIIAQHDNHPVWLIKMQQGNLFHSPCPGEEFAALVAIYDAAVTHEHRNTFCDALVAQGCRNGLFWGCDCSLWDDALDWASLATDAELSPSKAPFVMSSWYENQPLEDAIFGLFKCSAFDDFLPRNFVTISIGDGPENEIVAAIQSELAGSDTA